MGLAKPTLGFFSPRLGEGVVWKNTSDSEMLGTIVHEASHYLLAIAGIAARVTTTQRACPLFVSLAVASLAQPA